MKKIVIIILGILFVLEFLLLAGEWNEKPVMCADKTVCTRNHTDYVEMAKSPIEIYNVEEKKTEKFKIDTGAPKSVAGVGWIRQYCNDAHMDFDNLNKVLTGDIFILGNDEFRSLGRVKIPVRLVTTMGEYVTLMVEVHMIEKPIEI